MPRVDTAFDVTVIRHQHEHHRSSNTGRLAALAMPRCELVEYPWRDASAAPSFDEPGTWLLFPEHGRPAPAPGQVRRLVVLDATWSQARRMRQRIAALRGLPTFALPEAAPRARMREAPSPSHMATLEAIAAALAAQGDRAAADALLALYDDFASRLDAGRSGSRASSRFG